jgi:hypothetical protein
MLILFHFESAFLFIVFLFEVIEFAIVVEVFIVPFCLLLGVVFVDSVKFCA